MLDEPAEVASGWRRAFPSLAALAALLLFFGYLYRNYDQYADLFRFSWQMLLASASLVLVSILANGAVNFVLYRGLGANVGLNESVELAAANTLANQLPFAAGMIAKGVYLKRRYRMAYGRYLSATVALYLVFLATAGFTGVAVLGEQQLFRSIAAAPSLLAGFAVMAASIAVFWLPLQRLPLPARWENQLVQMWAGWEVLQANKVLVWKIVFLYLVMMLVISGRYWITFHMLSQPVTFANTLLFAAASILTQLVSATPGGLGVREGIVAAVAYVLGFDAGVSAVAVGLDRLIATALTLALGSLASYHLARRVGLNPPVDAGSRRP